MEQSKNETEVEDKSAVNALVIGFTHDELVEIGYRWALNKCGFAFKELTAYTNNGEIPDVIGYRKEGTFLLEAKTSRSDFFAGQKKFFRQMPEYGMGDWRFYIAPKGLLEKDDLPEMWGLIEVNEKGKARIKYNPFGKGNIYSSWERCEKCKRSEFDLMYSALRRLHLRKRVDEIYEM